MILNTSSVVPCTTSGRLFDSQGRSLQEKISSFGMRRSVKLFQLVGFRIGYEDSQMKGIKSTTRGTTNSATNFTVSKMIRWISTRLQQYLDTATLPIDGLAPE